MAVMKSVTEPIVIPWCCGMQAVYTKVAGLYT